MVENRQAFLATGAYEPVLDAVSAALQEAGLATEDFKVGDIGSGPGYYSAGLLERFTDRCLPARIVACDSSIYAVRRAAKLASRIGAIRADIWTAIPLRSSSLDAAIVIFSPRNAIELHRILAPRGSLIIVTPTPYHLREAVARFHLLYVPDDKEGQLHDLLGSHFEHRVRRELCYSLNLDKQSLRSLVLMGPSARHVSDENLQRGLRAITSFDTTVSVVINTFEARSA